MTKVATTLERIVAQLLAVSAGERDMYPYMRDLLSNKDLGIRLQPEQLVIDSALGKSSGAPDIAVYSSKNGKVVRSPDHLVAVFELKIGDGIFKNEAKVFEEKTKYVQSGTRYFFLIDQEVVSRRHVEHDMDEAPETFTWSELKNPETFQYCFGVIGRDQLRLEVDLERFIEGKTRFAYRNIDEFGRRQFISTIREVSQNLHEAVSGVVYGRIKENVTTANKLIEEMEKTWGSRRIDPEWKTKDAHPIEFARNVDDDSEKPLTLAEVDQYQEEHDAFALRVEPYLDALQIEYAALPRYASRLGVEEDVSLTAGSKPAKKVVESFIYETASLILSRMLMIRFSEDHGFMVRHISNGGVTTFTQYAKHFKKPFQTLLLQTYDNARALYRGLFEPGVLDWVLTGEEQEMSDAILHAMYLLSRWNFSTVHGDILSGVYDHYLETSKRRELGEVFTRPEIARYILERCGFKAGQEQTVLDPACGTGTFIVEALEAELKRLRNAGLMNLDTVKDIVPRLCGMDINPFSVSLAQIQVLWHLMELFGVDKGEKGKANKVASVLLPLLNIEGGTSSLETMGVPMGHQPQTELDLGLVLTKDRRRAATRFPTRFRRINSGKYDIVAGNPPYVRAHRRSVGRMKEQYGEVAQGQFDLYLLFVYRALRTWVKPGGRMGFVVPNAMLDAGYAGPLRSILLEFRLIEIVDLELLRKKTFHGVKRPTLILIIENSPGDDEDDVVVTTVPPSAYRVVDDFVDMDQASSVALNRRRLFQEAYLPGVAQQKWASLVDYDAGQMSPWTTKVVPGDLLVLDKISAAPRLGEIVRTAYRKKTGKGKSRVALTVPENEKEIDWEQVMLISTGLKLGGKKALDSIGSPIYKGQNLFPGGLIGEPLGRWKKGGESTAYLYTYAEFFDASRLYAFREIAQLPVACPVPPGVVFQNTVLLAQLDEPFPLDAWCMSRVIQFYAAKVMRSTVIEDLSAHWYKRQIALFPIPAKRSQDLRASLQAAGQKVIDADRDLGNRYRHLDKLVEAGARPLLTAFQKSDPRCAGIDFSSVFEEPIDLNGVRENGESIVTDDLLFNLVIPDAELRQYVLFALRRRLSEDESATIDRASILKLNIPLNLELALAEIKSIQKQDTYANFEAALVTLDAIVGQSLDLASDEISYIQEQMRSDPFLKQISILWEHRGPRVQAYSDSEGEDRYD